MVMAACTLLIVSVMWGIPITLGMTFWQVTFAWGVIIVLAWCWDEFTTGE